MAYELMLVVKGDASGATAEIVKTRNALDDLTKSATRMKKETPVTETYELSKATRQFGLALSGLSMVPVIGDFAAMGSMVTYSAGSIKNLTAAIKGFGGVSITALGPLGMAGAIGAAIGGGLLLGKVIDDLAYKITGVDIGGLHKLKDIMKDIKEETEFVSKRQETYNKQLAILGVAGATYEERVKNAIEMEKTGILVREEGTNKLIRASDVIAKKLKELEEAERKLMVSWVEDTNKIIEAQEKLDSQIQDMLDKIVMTPFELIRKQADEWAKLGADRVLIEKWVGVETTKVEKQMAEEAKKKADEILKNDIDVVKSRIDALKGWRDAIVSSYNIAISKANEYFGIAKSAGEISAGIREYLAKLKTPALSPYEQMSKERKAFEEQSVKAWQSWGQEAVDAGKKATEMGQAFIDKWGNVKNVWGEAMFGSEADISGVTHGLEELASRLDQIQEANRQAGISWQTTAEQMLSSISQIDSAVYDLQIKLQSLQMQLDVSPAIQAAQWARSQIDAILPDIIQKTINLNIEGLPSEGVSSGAYGIGPGGVAYPTEGWLGEGQFGIPSVPETGPYYLHKYETVLTPQEAREYRDNRNYSRSNNYSFTFSITGITDPQTFAKKAAKHIQREVKRIERLQ